MPLENPMGMQQKPMQQARPVQRPQMNRPTNANQVLDMIRPRPNQQALANAAPNNRPPQQVPLGASQVVKPLDSGQDYGQMLAQRTRQQAIPDFTNTMNPMMHQAGQQAGQDMSWMNRPGAISPQFQGGMNPNPIGMARQQQVQQAQMDPEAFQREIMLRRMNAPR